MIKVGDSVMWNGHRWEVSRVGLDDFYVGQGKAIELIRNGSSVIVTPNMSASFSQIISQDYAEDKNKVSQPG